MSRKSTPDVLGKVMGSVNPESNKGIKQDIKDGINKANKKAIGHNGNTYAKNGNNTSGKKVRNKITIQEWNNALQQEGPKEKATFNLTVEALDLLEDTWISLRKEKREAKITKSLIVEKAIRRMISDYDL